METRSFELESSRGTILYGTVQLPEQPGPRPTVVLCHGFKGFQEWGFFPALSSLLAKRGFTAIRFNFGGSGMRPDNDLATELEAFRTATFTGDVEDILTVFEAAGRTVARGRVERDRLGLFGHSRGGGAAILAAANDQLRQRLSALVTWAAVSTFDRLDDEQLDAWRGSGSLRVENARTGQTLEVGLEVRDDYEAHRDELDIVAAARRRTAPWLIVHGRDDETVPAEEAERLAAAAGKTSDLHLVTAASHTFGAVHPFAGPTPQLIEAFNLTQTWFRRHL